MVNKIMNPKLRYKGEDTKDSYFWAIAGWELIRDSRGVAIGRMCATNQDNEFTSF